MKYKFYILNVNYDQYNILLKCPNKKYTLLKSLLKVNIGNDQEKAQAERGPHSKNRGEKKLYYQIRYLYN